jgi:hypothetical protein
VELMGGHGFHWSPCDSGGGLVAVAAVAIIVLIVAGPVVHAAEDLVRLVLIAAAVLAVVAVAGVGCLAWRARRHRSISTRPAPFLTPAEIRAVQARTAPRAIAPPQIHVHLHGPVSAEDLAAIVAQRDAIQNRP